MGGVGVASAEGYEAAFANPALLSRIHRNRLAVGIQGASFSLSATDNRTGLSSRLSSRAAKGMVIGAELPLPFRGVLEDRIALGFGFYTPTEVLTHGRILYSDTPQYLLYPTRAETLTIRVGAGFDLGYGFRVGAGMAALADLEGQATLTSQGGGKVASKVETQLVGNYAPNLGVTYEFGKAHHVTRFGLSYRGALGARFAVRVDATKLSTLALPPFDISGLAQYDPAGVHAEFARDTPAFAYALGASWKRWSAYPGALDPTVRCPLDTPDCGTLAPPSYELSDTFTVRLGVEGRVRRMKPHGRSFGFKVRGGAFFEPTPLPASLPTGKAYSQTTGALEDVPTRTYDASRFALTVGTGIQWRAFAVPLSLDWHAQVHVLLARDMTSGTLSSARVSGHALATGLVLGASL